MRLILLFALLSFAITAKAQSGYWQQVPGPTGGYSRDIAAGPDGTIYLITNAGELWKRGPDDGGWKKVGPLPTGLDNLLPSPLFVAFGRIYLFNDVEGSSAFFSTDGGNSWLPTNCQIVAMTEVHNVLYAVNDASILRSTDSGFTWNEILHDTALFGFTDIVSSSNGKIYACGSGIYINVQGDSVWQKQTISGGTEWNFLADLNQNVCVAAPKVGYAGSVSRTTDGGMTWDSLRRGSFYPLAKDSSGVLWTINGYPSVGQVIFSSDSGITWNDGNFLGTISGTFCVGPSNDLYLRSQKHVYHYNRNSQQWTLWEDSLYIGDIFGAIALSDDTIVVANNQGFSRTTDRGQSWNLDSMDIGTGAGSRYSTLLEDREGYLYFENSEYVPRERMWEYQQDTVEIELNGKPFGQQFDAQVLAVDSSDNIYSMGEQSAIDGTRPLLRSSNHGSTWTTLFRSTMEGVNMSIDSKGRILYAVGNGGTAGLIIRSSDHGNTWDTIYPGSNRFDDIGPIVVTQNGTILAADDGIIESTDDGLTWQYYDQFSPWCFVLDGANKLYAAGIVQSALSSTPTMGVMLSTDTGETVQLISTSLQFDTGFAVVAVSPNHTLYSGTIEDGLFRYVPSTAGVTILPNSEPALSIFPNPTTGLITITGAVGTVTVENILGQAVQITTQLPTISGGGVTLDLSNATAGIYFMRVEMANGTVTQKIVKE